MNDQVYDILRFPHVTEKGTVVNERAGGGVAVFKVRKSASKHQIRQAVERLFDVKVDKVRTANFQGKLKRQGRRSGRRPAWKKAYVTLKPGEKAIEFFESV